jgi:hypothetical protein
MHTTPLVGAVGTPSTATRIPRLGCVVAPINGVQYIASMTGGLFLRLSPSVGSGNFHLGPLPTPPSRASLVEHILHQDRHKPEPCHAIQMLLVIFVNLPPR